MTQIYSLDGFLNLNSLQKAVELHSILTHQSFAMKDLDLPKRTVMHWDNTGLVSIERISKVERRRFSLMDFFWLHMVQEMRNMGLPVSVIMQAKETLLTPISLQWIADVIKLHPEVLDRIEGDAAKEELLSFLEFEVHQNLENDPTVTTLMLLVVESLSKRIPVTILVFGDGYTIPWYENSPERYEDTIHNKKTQEPFLSVPIVKILKRLLREPKSMLVLNKTDILSQHEKQLLEIIHEGKYDSVTIQFSDKKMKSLELIKDQDVRKRIVDVIADGSYQDIVIKTHAGRVTKIQNKVKVHFK